MNAVTAQGDNDAATGHDVAWYVYAIIQADRQRAVPMGEMPPGIDVQLIMQDGLAAVASEVSRAAYTGAAQQAGDPEWVAAQAQIHHGIVAAASHVTCLPVRFGTLFATTDTLRAWLQLQAPPARAALQALHNQAEWTVTLQPDVPAHMNWLMHTDAELVALTAQIGVAGPGAGFLLGKRLIRRQEAAAAVHFANAAKEIETELRVLSPHVLADAPAGNPLSFNFLADKSAQPAAALQRLMERFAAIGLSLRITGPWPPYAFAHALWAAAP